jgi:multidrug resistance efflux pump
LLVELDNADAHAQAAKARAQLRAAQADLAAVRSGGTHEEVLTTRSQLAKARVELETAQRNVEALQRLHGRHGTNRQDRSRAAQKLQRQGANP